VSSQIHWNDRHYPLKRIRFRPHSRSGSVEKSEKSLAHAGNDSSVVIISNNSSSGSSSSSFIVEEKVLLLSGYGAHGINGGKLLTFWTSSLVHLIHL
jgi:hypothetical protein